MSARPNAALHRLARAAVEAARQAGASRSGVFLVGRVVSPLQRWLYRASRGRLSLTGHAPVLLLTTTGRRTGRPRTVPVFYLRDGERVMVCNVTPPGEGTNPWTLNLRADPRATIEIRGDTIEAVARPATDDEVARYWPPLTAIWPAYQRFVDRGGARSIFVLDPVEA
jgi:deazaflavin-dependent oxidoreductase (nitroreductase family)